MLRFMLIEYILIRVTCFKNTLPKDIRDVSGWTPMKSIATTNGEGRMNSQELPQDVDAPTLCMQMGDDDMEEDGSARDVVT